MKESKKTYKPRKAVITVRYHYTGPGRRAGLRNDIKIAVMSAVARRLYKHGSLVVDSIEMKDA